MNILLRKNLIDYYKTLGFKNYKNTDIILKDILLK